MALASPSAASGAMARLALTASLVALMLCNSAIGAVYEPVGFIKVCKGRFADQNGRAWYFSGAHLPVSAV
jgi:hypothetical protein